jgi:hypothetical protein
VKYYIIYRNKRNTPVKFMVVESELPEYYTGVYMREKGYRILLCESKENIDRMNRFGREIFLKIYKQFKVDVWEIIEKIDTSFEYGSINIKDVKNNERENKYFRRNYTNYFGIND